MSILSKVPSGPKEATYSKNMNIRLPTTLMEWAMIEAKKRNLRTTTFVRNVLEAVRREASEE